MRWLAIALVLGLVSTADAQVFKPKGKKSEVIEKKTEKKSAKKAPKGTKKKVTAKSRKSAASDSDDSESDAPSKTADNDFVKVTDDDDIE